jgi:hypothetical protein
MISSCLEHTALTMRMNASKTFTFSFAEVSTYCAQSWLPALQYALASLAVTCGQATRIIRIKTIANPKVWEHTLRIVSALFPITTYTTSLSLRPAFATRNSLRQFSKLMNEFGSPTSNTRQHACSGKNKNKNKNKTNLGPYFEVEKCFADCETTCDPRRKGRPSILNLS